MRDFSPPLFFLQRFGGGGDDVLRRGLHSCDWHGLLLHHGASLLCVSADEIHWSTAGRKRGNGTQRAFESGRVERTSQIPPLASYPPSLVPQYKVNCDAVKTLPSVTFHLGGQEYSLTQEDYILWVRMSGDILNIIMNNKNLAAPYKLLYSPAHEAKHSFIAAAWIYMFLHKTCSWLINFELYSLQHPDKCLGLSLITLVWVDVRGSMTPFLFYFKIHFPCESVTFFCVGSSNHRSRETSASLPSEVWTFRPQ